MQIIEKGTPPYTVMTGETTPMYGGASQPSSPSTYIDALARMIDLTAGGTITFNPTNEITPIRIIDSKKEVVFSADNPEDMNILKLIVQSGLPYEKIAIVKNSS